MEELLEVFFLVLKLVYLVLEFVFFGALGIGVLILILEWYIGFRTKMDELSLMR